MAKSGIELTDSIDTFERGMNAGLHPLLIPKNQLAFAFNATVRGGLASNRPPFTRGLAISWQSDEVRDAVQKGLFQGAWIYVPDTGSSSLLASISGRLFQFKVFGRTVSVTDVSVVGDLNPASSTQAWLWQSEKWIICDNGVNLPIFFDGVSSRRSYGVSRVLDTVSAVTNTTPEIGEVFTATIGGDYAGPYDVPVLFNGEYYQPIKNLSGYSVALTTLYDTTAAPHAIGTDVIIQPGLVGYLKTAIPAGSGTKAAGTYSKVFDLSTPYTGLVGGLLAVTSATNIYNQTPTTVWRVTSVSGNSVSVVNNESLNIATIKYPVGTAVKVSGSSAPNVNLGSLIAALPVTSFGTTQVVAISKAYTGIAGQIVTIGNAQYSIESSSEVIGSPPAAGDIYLVNLSDTTAIAAPKEILSVPELPAGRMGAYGMGQNWVSLVDGKSFIVSDISRGPSGTQANDYRDAVLKTVDLTFGGDSFAIPSAGSLITSMTFTSKMDESLGQGPLQIGTNTSLFSVNAPFDFENPPAIGTPILPEVLRGKGPVGQNSTIPVNSDTFFRTQDGLASFIQARRDFQGWGNAGISDEINDRLLDLDDQKLLPYGSAIEFDNRHISTLSPQASNGGVIHAGLAVINLDPVSSLSGKTESVYDGLWTGLNTLQLLAGLFDGESRAFAFTYNISTLKIELYEILPTKTENQNDNGYIPITWGFESSVLFNKDVKPRDQRMRLTNGEFGVDRVLGAVRFKVWYRFDTDCWIPWHEFAICSSGDTEQDYPNLGLGEPSGNPCNRVTGFPSREGYKLQVKFQITGRCRFLGAKFVGVTIDSPKIAPPISGVGTCKARECSAADNPQDLQVYSLQTNIQFNGTPITTVVDCPPGADCEPTITWPPDDIIIPPQPPGGNEQTVYYLSGCLSQIAYVYTAESIAAAFAELTRQAAICNEGQPGFPDGGGSGGGGSGIVSPPGNGPTITLSDLI